MKAPLTMTVILADLEPMKEAFRHLLVIALDPDMPERLRDRMIEIVDPMSVRLGNLEDDVC